MFVDKVRITVIGGRGGDGAVAFHREKYVASGGPDGGDGGHGGSVILRVDDNMTTLLDFRYKRKYTAGAGVNGMGRKMSGKRGEPLIIKVPRGTVVRDAETNQIIVDMSTEDDFVIAKGGRGGWGNSHYATATRQVPRFAKSGRKGEERDIILELKLLADVGLVGFPNVGKSTLLSVTSNARPKIANYHFTTLYPNLGYMADAPLDMRMDKRSDLTAGDIINGYSEAELYRVIRDYGEEKFAKNIAKHIVAARADKEIRTTFELVDVIRAAIPMKVQKTMGHPAKQTFQAIRIELNRELDVLRDTLDTMIDLLSPGGRLCIITFHSLEDRIVKAGFKRNEDPCTCPRDFPVCVCGKVSRGRVITKKPILPSEEEMNENPRSKSAKLRVFEKTQE